MSIKQIEDVHSDIIKGAFIECFKVSRKTKQFEMFHIKLSQINTIHDEGTNEEGQQFTSFYTYKDCHYIAKIEYMELIRIINMFIFKPDEHCDIYFI